MKRLILFLFLLAALPAIAQHRPGDHRPGMTPGTDADDRYWDSSFGPGNGLTGPWYSGVTDIIRMGNHLYVSGQFTHAGDVAARNIARYDGEQWEPVGGGGDSGVSGAILALAMVRGELYAGGNFDTIGGVHTGPIARWDGTRWHRLGPGLTGQVMTMMVLGDDLFVGGSFRVGDSGVQAGVAHWSGAEWTVIGSEIDGNVHAFALYNGTLLIGGDFTSAAGIRTGPIARYAPGSGQWRPFADELRDTISGQAVVWTMAADGNDLYVGGRFDRAGENILGNIARLNGEKWDSVGSGLSEGNPALVYTLALTPDELFAGGTFGKAGARGAAFIARWNRAAREWYPLGSGVRECEGFECYTGVAALLPEGEDLYVGGNFTIAGQKPSLMIGRWTMPVSSAVEETSDRPATALHPTPSPFAERTTITFALAGRADVRLVIVDAAGRDLATLVEAPLPAGDHTIDWDGSGYPPGVYFCRLEIDDVTTVAKMVKTQ